MLPVTALAADEATVTINGAATAAPGDTITISADVSVDGAALTELGDYQFTFWADSWNDHSDGNSDAVITNEHAIDGSTTVSLPTEGTYYIVGELYDAD